MATPWHWPCVAGQRSCLASGDVFGFRMGLGDEKEKGFCDVSFPRVIHNSSTAIDSTGKHFQVSR